MPSTLSRILTLGVVCGMRAALGPALVSHHVSRQRAEPLGRLEVLRAPALRAALSVAAVGELVGDKLPAAPARVEPAALAGRFASGALCGAALSRLAGKRSAVGAVVGALGAGAGAYAFYELRRTLTREGRLPDTVVALAEDALALALGRRALED